ncbi:helix-turn-helix domain-containing protein [Lysobacter sp. CCNWLW3]|uniref:helix-turn-helix domain-containing protein n=1 Tax=Lysobacter sp. CCNWLW3 TaxID=3117014 RepID=UPI002FD70A72
MARRHAGMSQAALGSAVGVQRSAVGHWESAQGKFPSVSHLREVALITGVQFEWLATGRGKMNLSADTEMDSVAAAEALLVDDPLELRLIVAFRDTPTKSKAPLVEIAEQLAELRTGRPRATLTKGARVVL